MISDIDLAHYYKVHGLVMDSLHELSEAQLEDLAKAADQLFELACAGISDRRLQPHKYSPAQRAWKDGQGVLHNG